MILKNIAIIAATKQELLPLIQTVKKNKKSLNFCSINFHYTGVGSLVSTFFITTLLAKKKYDIVFQVGIAGALKSGLQIGEAVVVHKEYMADIGVFEDKKWNDIFDMGFTKPSAKPFTNKALVNKWCDKLNTIKCKTVNGITVNTISTNKELINTFTSQYNAQIETMEGAALHYVANSLNIPYLQIRGISNILGDRNKKNWSIQEAIVASNQLAFDLLLQLR